MALENSRCVKWGAGDWGLGIGEAVRVGVLVSIYMGRITAMLFSWMKRGW